MKLTLDQVKKITAGALEIAERDGVDIRLYRVIYQAIEEIQKAMKGLLAPEYKEYQKQVVSNAQAMAEAFVSRGYKIVSGGTDNHLMLIDLRTKFPELTGKVAEKELGKADITVNKNMVPFDSRSPFLTSGIRVGTPAITSRGFVEKDMEFIVNLIDMVLTNAANHLDLIKGTTEEGREEYEALLDQVKKQVRMKTNGMPLNRY